MKLRMTVSIFGAAAAVAGMGLGAGATASAAPATSGQVGLVAQTQTVAPAWLVTNRATITPGAKGGGSAPLPASVPAGSQPRVADIGDSAASGSPHVSSLSRSQQHGSANPSYPTVPGSPVAGASTGLTSVAGLNGYDEGATHPTSPGQAGVDIEPPDQGVCSNGSYTLELNNMVAEVFKGTAGQGAASLESFFHTPEIFGAANDGTLSVQGDPRCFYDPATQRWFASQLWLDENDATSFGWAGTFVAASTSSSPTGTWNVYFVPDADNATGTGTCNNDAASNANANPCFGDQPLLGVDASSVQISTNEYSIFGATPNGPANLYFLSKADLLSGDAKVPTRWVAPGSVVATPGVGPWYSLAPAQAPNGAYDTSQGGTSYALSALDFTGSGDNRIAEWAYTHTSAVDTAKGQVQIYEQTLSSGAYAMPPAYAAQKAGNTPLGDNWNQLTGAKSRNALPEGGLATNDDRMGTATYDATSGALIGGLNTGVNQASPTGSSTSTLTAVAYFVVTPAMSAAGLNPSAVTTGYISPSGANALFPAAAVGSSGKGLIAYSLSGTGYYPSTAYSLVNSGDVVDPTSHVARAGVGPQDGFSEYQGAGTSSYRPRWGDYSEAVANGSTVTFASEMINQTCTDAQFAADFTCGGTRDLFINWGTSVDTLTP